MRPYYTDPYTVSFDADVLEVFEKDGRNCATLDKTYFYPTSGGQEHDAGTINGVPVVDVYQEGETIVHVLSDQMRQGSAHCEIEWERRLSNMQQHTGQHILSAAFENLFKVATVSSRLGEDVGTIDLSRQPTDEELRGAVSEANRVIQENRDVVIHFADQDRVKSFNLRKQPKVTGTVRIVEVKGFDMSPCGGTHCTHTSEVGVVLTGNTEKVKGSLTRIEFCCGNRAISNYYRLHSASRDTARILSAMIDEMPAAVERLKEQIQQRDARIKFLSEGIMKAKCGELAPQVEASPAGLVVVDLTDDTIDANELRFIASCVSRSVKRSFAFHRHDSNISQMNLNLVMTEEGAISILNEMKSTLGVKGGGRNGFYSLTFDSSRLDDVVDALKGHLQNG